MADQAESPTTIRCGFHHLPALSQASAQRLISERQRQPFTSLSDLRRRVRLSAGDLDMMARAGALDALYPQAHRGQLLWLARQVGLQPLPKPATSTNSIYYRRPNIMTQRFLIYRGQISAAVPRPN